jgi:hypothetical protein
MSEPLICGILFVHTQRGIKRINKNCRPEHWGEGGGGHGSILIVSTEFQSPFSCTELRD